MRLSLIWAMTRNRVIGRNNALPWRLPDEMRHFMRTTLGHCVIMGRRNFDAMGKPLPKRTNIVLSRDPSFVANGAIVVRTLDEAIERARDAGDDEAMVVGGAEIYALALPKADRLYFTLVDTEMAGDTFFPLFDEAQWREVRREEHGADAQHPYAYTIRVLDRIPKNL
jgi:dihydrofolate reductase